MASACIEGNSRKDSFCQTKYVLMNLFEYFIDVGFVLNLFEYFIDVGFVLRRNFLNREKQV